MKKITMLLLAVLLSVPVPVFARPFPVTESNSNIPYVFKAAIQVDESPRTSLLNNSIRFFTLGFLGSKTDIEYVKDKLKKKIEEQAKLYSPDAVVNVVYSPHPDDPRFLTSDKVYAKGDMVTYDKAYTY